MHGEGGQATVEWVALVLLAALVLTAGAALSKREADRDLGELVAKRIARVPSDLARSGRTQPAPARTGTVGAPEALGAAPPHGAAPSAPAHGAVPPAPGRAPTPPAPARRASAPPPAVDAFRRLRGVADVAKRAWILCLGYRRWKYELEHPSAPNEALPVDEALSIVNTCFNPHDYLLED